MSLGDLYREVILDHYQRPRHRGSLPGATVSVGLNNPVCGDEIVLQLLVRDGRVAAASFAGQGCAISQASASMMTEAVRGLSVDEVRTLLGEFRTMVKTGVAPDDWGDLAALAGVVQFPTRVKCAMLAWEALERSLDQSPTDG